MSWTDNRSAYEALARDKNKDAILTTKDHWLWSALWWLGVVLTLGLFAVGISRKRFLTEFATTIGPVQGYPKEWPSLDQVVVIHECEHVRQMQLCGFGNAWVGLLLYTLLYILLPVPLGFAWFRYYFERRADEVAWKWAFEMGTMNLSEILAQSARRAKMVSGGSYFWSVPFKFAQAGYLKAADRATR